MTNEDDFPVVSRVELWRDEAHDRVAVFNRSHCAGVLVADPGDGPKLAARLMGFEDGSEEATDLATDFAQHEGPGPAVYEC